MSSKPLIVKSNTTGVTGFLFKNPINKDDRNIYGMIPIHALTNYLDLKSDKFLLLGNDSISAKSIIILDAIYFSVKNFLLDCAMFIIQNTETIYGTAFEECLNISFHNERDIYIDKINILSQYKGKVSTRNVDILDKCYVIGSNENKLLFQEIPEPGLIQLAQEAKSGLSGSPIINNGIIYGFISRASGNFDNNESNENNCLAIHSFYMMPWISTVCQSVYQYIGDTYQKVKSLLLTNTMEMIKDNITPSVLSLGCSHIHYPYGNDAERQRLGVLIYIIYNYLDIDYFYRCKDRQSTNSLKYESLMNANNSFIDEFNSDVIDSSYFITKLEYTDVMNTSKKITIDYNNTSKNANINEYYFRGSKEHPVTLHIVKEIRNGDNVSDVVPPLEYTFNPKPTSENIWGVNYSRQTSELPKMYYNTIESLHYNYDSGSRLTVNSYNTPSVDLVKYNYPGIKFLNSYLNNADTESQKKDTEIGLKN